MLKFTDIIMSGKIMYNKTLKFLSKKMKRKEIIDITTNGADKTLLRKTA